MAHKPTDKTRLNLRKPGVQQRSAATVDAVLEAAIRILTSRGYSAMTTSAVADLAGVSVGSLYQYFPNRLAIVAELFRRHVAEIIAAITATHLSEAAEFRSAVGVIMRSLIDAEVKQRAVSLALNSAVQDVHGREIASTAADGIAQSLATMLQPHLRRPWTDHDTVRLGLAIASVEGMMWAVNERAPNLLETDGLAALLTESFMTAFEA
jgi:AcrR family transcriptional regulator